MSRRAITVVLVLQMLAPAALHAQRPPDLANTSIEDLMNIEVSSASHIQQRRSDVPAAVYVITAEQIRRSGATLLPELLRGVPGLDVARINSNQWAISARGFNDLWANKLLVLIDGRSVYSRTSSGVEWYALDLPLDDIERIEVTRGPGGSVWGANAVNGVINIVTKSARDTQGVSVGVDAGSLDRDRAAVRYGGTSGNTAYRVYSQWSDHASLHDASGASAGDTWRGLSAGVRADWTRGADTVTAEGAVIAGHQWPLWSSFTGPTPTLSLPAPASADSVVSPTFMVDWTHGFASGASFETKAFTDLRRRRIGNDVAQDEAFADVEAQLTTKMGRRHQVAVGGGYRRSAVDVSGNLNYSLTPSRIDFDTENVFAQDDISLPKRVRLSLGSRFEHDDQAGNALEPSARVMWDATSRTHVWAAFTHADRTPGAVDLFVRSNFAAMPGPGGLPILIGYLGSPTFKNEEVTNLEAGYRLDLHATASIDVNAYRARYNHVSTTEPLAPVFELTPAPAHLFVAYQLDNLQSVTTAGVEVGAHWMPVSTWRLDASYTGFQFTPDVDPASQDPMAAAGDGNAPAQQWQLRSSAWVGARAEFDAGVFHASRLVQMSVPAYTRVDARVAFTVSPRWTLAVTGQNLLDASHQEFAPIAAVTPTLIPRSIGVHLDWRVK